MRFPSALALEDLAAELGGELDEAARAKVIVGAGPIESAGEGFLAPVVARRFLRAARESSAVLLVQLEIATLVPVGLRWVHPHAMFTLATLLARIAPPPAMDDRGRAFVDPAASVSASASIGAGAVIHAGAVVGAGSRIEPNAVVYGGSILGERVVVGAGAVIGRPGFGWTPSPSGELLRIPQLGGVIIEDDVEIGPLCTIDAGTLGPTTIERGVKLDAHVHVGHNARIGKGTLVAAQAGFAGSVDIGERVRVGGQAGVADHVCVGDAAELGAKAGVIGDVSPGTVVAGYPAVERARWLRGVARALRDDRRPTRRRSPSSQ